MDEKLKMVNFLGQYLAASRSEGQIFDMALMISQNVMGFDHAIIRMLEKDLLITRSHIGFPRDAADIVIKLGEGITGEVAKTGQAIVSEDTQKDPRFLKGVDGCRSELCVPLTYNKATIGVINLESEKPGFFTKQDKSVMETLASQMAAAMETKRLRDELMRAEKLSVVGQMASSILHDIRNDIHTLNISADLLKSRELNPRLVKKVSEMVKGSGENIYGLIEDIFEFVKTGESRLYKKGVNLSGLLRSVLEETKSGTPDNVRVNLSSDESIEIEVDRRRFKRALLNLVSNGVEAMPEGGELTISASVKGGRVVIEIGDTGVGIENWHIEKIWEPLFTHGKKRGTGLGMAIVKKIVEDHGWKIGVESHIGKGTTFTITQARGTP
ncbi:hypothetical protein MNBD_NITROSPINAE02-1461 [hydrothermal vent metagenome]|uniref:Histidine kinase domain-containing protein n=1 Tax=hydrothermal vent metagenome TaxID=652676 RepID=A0A3B1CA83_9ZZZZ